MFVEEFIILKLCLELIFLLKLKCWDKFLFESIFYDWLIGYFLMILINFLNVGLDFDKIDKVVKLYFIWKNRWFMILIYGS